MDKQVVQNLYMQHMVPTMRNNTNH